MTAWAVSHGYSTLARRTLGYYHLLKRSVDALCIGGESSIQADTSRDYTER